MPDEPFIARGFRGRRAAAPPGRLPPGQYEDARLPGALRRPDAAHAARRPGTSPSAGSTAREAAGRGTSCRRCRTRRRPWTSTASPSGPSSTPPGRASRWTRCSTPRRSTGWPAASTCCAFCDGGYTTNLPLADVTGGRAWVAFGYDGAPLAPEHGGPARLLVPHLYFWKSAKWVRGLAAAPRGRSRASGRRCGYHDRGDPWREQRYQGDPEVAAAACRGAGARLAWRRRHGRPTRARDAARADAGARRAATGPATAPGSTSTCG